MLAYAILVGIVTSICVAYFLQWQALKLKDESHIKPEKKVITPTVSFADSDGWKLRRAVAQYPIGSHCDLLRVDISKINSHLLGDLFRSNVPFIIENAMDDWPAMKAWSREYFLDKFGDRTVKADSEATIVEGGGVASPALKLHQVMEQVRNCSLSMTRECRDSFVFDASILRAIPELDRDIRVLPAFEAWDNKNTREAQTSWHILSLGPIETGLPFHSHGKTWLSLVHGAKSWYLYPPGFDLPTTAFPEFLLLEAASDVRDAIEDRLGALPTPMTFHPANYTWTHNHHSDADDKYKPLTCLQRAGEIMYLPDLWLHLTVNEGETVAYGGQATITPEARLALAQKKLAEHPNDFESLKNAGLGLGHMAISLWHKIRSGIQPSGAILRVRDTQTLHELVEMTQDIWVTVHFDDAAPPTTTGESEGPSVSALLVREMLLSIAEKGQGHWNFAILQAQADWLAEKARKQESIALDTMRVTMDSKPILKSTVHYQPTHRHSTAALSEDILQWIAATIHVYYLESGGVITGTSRQIERMVTETTAYLQQAIDLRPLRVDCFRLLAEVQGSLGRFGDAKAVIQKAVVHFEQELLVRHKLGLTKQRSASIFHQLATSLLSLSLGQEALPILELALRCQPSHPTILADRVVASVMAGNVMQATQHLASLQQTHPQHPDIARLKRMIQGKQQQQSMRRG